jgi:hypothetical protein
MRELSEILKRYMFSGRSIKYAAKFSCHNRTKVGCGLNFITRVCDLICRCKQKSYAAEKGPRYVAAKHKSAAAAKRKVAKRNAAKRKSSVASKQVPVTATPRTPLNKGDCIDAAQGFLCASANFI